MKNKNDAKNKLMEIHKMYLANEKLENLVCKYQLWTKKWESFAPSYRNII